MGGSRVQINKVHKTRFASKSSQQEHRIPIKDKSRGAKPDKNAFKGASVARIQRSKMVLITPYGDMVSCMEMAKVADLITFVVSANSLDDVCETSSFVDLFGIQCLTILRAIGLPSTTVLIRDLPFGMRGKQDVKKIAISCHGSELPEDCRFYAVDTKEDLHKFMWLLKEQHLSARHW